MKFVTVQKKHYLAEALFSAYVFAFLREARTAFLAMLRQKQGKKEGKIRFPQFKAKVRRKAAENEALANSLRIIFRK